MTLPLDIQTPGPVAPQPNSAAERTPQEPGTAGTTGPGPSRRVMGVDLSLTRTGIATRHGAEIIATSGHLDDTLAQRRQRISRIRAEVIGWCTNADLVVIEAPSYGSKGGSAHDRAGLWWLVVSALMHRDIPVLDVSPKTRAKYATGNGNADKDEVLAAAVRRLPIAVSNNNTADAAWLVAIGHDLYGEALVQLPQTHRAALDTLRARADLLGVT